MPTPEETPVSVAYLTTARLGEKGQLNLPKAYRDAVALDTGAPITVLQVGRALLLIPDDARFRELCDQVAATFARHGKQAPLLPEPFPDRRERFFTRHYPQLADRTPTRARRSRP